MPRCCWRRCGANHGGSAPSATPFMTFHVTARSLWIGGTAGSLVSTLVIAWSVFLTRHTSARQLLAGQTSSTVNLSRTGRVSAGH